MRAGYEVVVGLEVHVQLRTRTKLFCACPNQTGAPPNSLTCPVCLGLPGALPVLNGEAVRQALRFGLAVQAELRPRSAFYRKQYFYPDLPKGYQITQGPVALVEEGRLEIPGDPAARGGTGPVAVRILRAHLEEDAGKSLHDLAEGLTHVDLNRAGVPLLEVVGAPDLRSPQEASDYLKSLHRLVVGLGISEGNLEEGQFRCDANVSVRPAGSTALGTRVEIKNLNSFRFVRQALAHEVDRQIGCLARGEALVQETRGWDATAGVTRAQRGKETAPDYRTFPEPDLPELVVDPAVWESLRASLEELPEARVQRWQTAHGLGLDEARALDQSPAFARYFEALTTACGSGRAAAAWMLGEVSRLLNKEGWAIEAFPLSPERLGELVALVASGQLALGAARERVLPELLAGDEQAQAVVVRLGLATTSDPAEVERLVDQVLAAHPQAVADLKGGKASLQGFLIGQALKAGGGRLDARQVAEVLRERLAKG